MRALIFGTALVLGGLAAPVSARAQSQVQPPETGSISLDDAARLSQGWALLAKGEAGAAFQLADDVARRAPRSTAAASLAIEATLSASGAATALNWYEQWLGNRSVEEAGLLRTVARAMLVEVAGQPQNPRARRIAVEALAQAGEAPILEDLRQRAAVGGFSETTILAATGDNAAVQILIAELSVGQANKLDVIEALAASHSAAAVAPLAQVLLTDGTSVLRFAAADALGEIGDPAAVPHLKVALGGPNEHLRIRAAGALLKLKDATGVALLRNLAKSSYANERVMAARALAARPDEDWLRLTRNLLDEADPDVRLAAAAMLAPVDPQGARAAIERLSTDSNPAIRDEGALLAVEYLSDDFRTLRGWMKSADRVLRVRAAGRVLSLLE